MGNFLGLRCFDWLGVLNNHSDGDSLRQTLICVWKPVTQFLPNMMTLLWQLAALKWRAGCAERCTSGSERRGWEIVRLRPVSYSTSHEERVYVPDSHY